MGPFAVPPVVFQPLTSLYGCFLISVMQEADSPDLGVPVGESGWVNSICSQGESAALERVNEAVSCFSAWTASRFTTGTAFSLEFCI